MGNQRANAEKRRDKKRVDGRFLAIPHHVLRSTAYRHLSHPARALLIDIALQYMGDNNGRLRTSLTVLGPLGWRSADVVNRAKKQLLEAELIYETVMGYRPNKASWYAVTWMDLDVDGRFDAGAARGFKRGAYAATVTNAALIPSAGAKGIAAVPADGAMHRAAAPADGAVL